MLSSPYGNLCFTSITRLTEGKGCLGEAGCVATGSIGQAHGEGADDLAVEVERFEYQSASSSITLRSLSSCRGGLDGVGLGQVGFDRSML